MTNTDIIRLAREAAKGRTANNEIEAHSLVGKEEISRFAALVAAAEREECAKVCQTISDKWAFGHYGHEVDAVDECAAAIRARGRP